jgi:hypothetical protein
MTGLYNPERFEAKGSTVNYILEKTQLTQVVIFTID